MMDNPGVFSLGDFTITAAGTQVGDVVTGLDGMLAALLQLRLVYGSGGTTVKAYVQCSADQETTWYDVACVAFGTASEVALLNLSALTPKTTAVVPSDGALADDTVVDGLLTDRMRLKVVSVGTYAGQTVLSARLVAR
ncbi:MAG: hypothetical protein E5W43_00880 [Mesorhizobium sp.]|nr:MAG: hypothetical protein E5W43_00880 [Mesorhizobium sp.]